ncbi:MAG TPA: hypothetical protein VGX51_00075 [Solirubrobacteraceae bacterium]|nr:hypothetical protein [Solirubrobacteraceae bacterium]
MLRLVALAAAGQLEEQQEDVADVEKDAGRDRNRAFAAGAAEPVEVKERESAKDDQPDNAGR